MAIVKIRTEYCKGCQLCIEVCPKHLLAVADVLNELGVQPVEVVGDASECVGCMSCVLMCPEAAIEIVDEAVKAGKQKRKSK